jgi:hypothetical protein
LFANARRLWLYGRISFSTFVKRQSFGTNREVELQLKEILSKMIIDNKNYASGGVKSFLK